MLRGDPELVGGLGVVEADADAAAGAGDVGRPDDAGVPARVGRLLGRDGQAGDVAGPVFSWSVWPGSRPSWRAKLRSTRTSFCVGGAAPLGDLRAVDVRVGARQGLEPDLDVRAVQRGARVGAGAGLGVR